MCDAIGLVNDFMGEGVIKVTKTREILRERKCSDQDGIIQAQAETIKELQTLDRHLTSKEMANIQMILDACKPFVKVIVIYCPICGSIQYIHVGNGHGVTKGYCAECLKKYKL